MRATHGGPGFQTEMLRQGPTFFFSLQRCYNMRHINFAVLAICKGVTQGRHAHSQRAAICTVHLRNVLLTPG